MKLLRPKCPSCNKVIADWLDGEAGYTCPRCKLSFTLNTVRDYSSYKLEKLDFIKK